MNSTEVTGVLRPSVVKPAHILKEQSQLVTLIVLASEMEVDSRVHLRCSV